MFIEVYEDEKQNKEVYINVSQIKLIYRQIKPTKQSNNSSWIYIKTIDDKIYLVDNDYSGLEGLKHYREFINKINNF